MPIQWNDSFSVHNKLIDKQHKDLIDTINSLHQALREADAETTVPIILDKLLHYVEVHFRSEEELMQSANYPYFSAHHDIHIRFENHILSLKNEFDSRKIEFQDMLELYLYLQEWINHHVLNEDKQLIPFIGEK